MTSLQAERSDVTVREITDQELAFYEEHGWVKLDGFVDRDYAGQLLEAGKELMERTQAGWDSASVASDALGGEAAGWRTFPDWQAITGPGFGARALRVDPFYSFMLGKELGRAAHRLQNRKRLTDEEIGVRFCDDLLSCLLPDKESRSHRWHQDSTFGSDRTGGFNVWIAIDEVIPEQGAMRFLTGSHREGPLGEKFGEPGATVLDRYPKLMDIYELSPPFHYQPGDTTIHAGLTIHGTPENLTDKPRWSFIPTYIPADNVEVNHGGLGFPAPHERFPLVYP